jgi:tetratricopeptide (TPR) repeat protein
VDGEPRAVDELIGSCANLPLALSVVAARAATRPGLALAGLAVELRDSRHRFDALDAGDTATDVRAVFSWSYEQLGESAARVFRLLGVHPGPDISAPAAASLAGIAPAGARAALSELTRAHMVAEHVPGRFAFHDLLRAYAIHQAEACDAEADRRAALHRVLDTYLHTAHAAALQVNPLRKPLGLVPPRPGAVPEDFSGKGEALAWLHAEHPVLLAVIPRAVDSGLDAYAWQIPWALAPYFNRAGRWHDCAEAQRIALSAAQRLGNQAALGHAHYELGRACALLGDYGDAQSHLCLSLDLFRNLGDLANEALAQHGFAVMFDQQRCYAEALGHATEALRLFQAAGHRSAQATSENGVGWLCAHLGRYAEALSHCQRALELHRESGHRGGAADAWDSLGYTHNHLGDHSQAVACYQQALEIYREIGDRYHEACALTGLGDTQLATGDNLAVRDSWQQALIILDSLPHQDAEQVRAKLRDLDSECSAGLVADPT